MIRLIIALGLMITLGAASVQAQQSGVFPPEPFNGLQAQYQIAGATVAKSSDTPGFTWTRTLTLTALPRSKQLSVSGTLTADWGYFADVVVSVSSGNQNASKTYKIEPKKPQQFSVSVPIPANAANGSVSINMTGHYNVGTRGVIIRGGWDSYGQTAPAPNPDLNKGPQSPVARMKEILRQYRNRMPEGRAADGPDNNKLALFKDGYDEFACGAYQSRTLAYLSGLRFSGNPKERALMEGFEFGPIQGYVGPIPFGHQAVIIFPKGTDWKETGTVLDPWPTQKHDGKPITYTVAEWTRMFPGIDKSGYYPGKFCWGSYDNPNSFKLPDTVQKWGASAPPALKSKWKAISDPYQRNLTIQADYQRRKEDARVIAHCPLHVYLVDGQGRVSGFPGGTARAEIPNTVITTFRLPDGTDWTELSYRKSADLKVVFDGTGDGQADIYAGHDIQTAHRGVDSFKLNVMSGQRHSLSQTAGRPVMRTEDTARRDTHTSQARTIFSNWNIARVYNAPRKPTVFSTRSPLRVTYVNTYHYNSGNGARAGSIALRHADGTVYGPWKARGVLSSGAPDGTWEVTPGVLIKPGRYTVIDSDPATWSQNQESGGCGFSEVRGTPSSR